MTRERAIELLSNVTVLDDPEMEEAHKIAISALRQETVTNRNGLIADDLVPEMTLDDAIAHLDDTLSDTGRKWSCESCRIEHVQLRAWLAELRDIKQKRNEPLTLDELRETGGEPVWIKLFDKDEEFWVLRYDWVDTRNPEPMILLHMRWYSHADYGKTWLAYRHKPEEGTV